MGTQSEPLTLRWANCGPEFNRHEKAQLADRIQKYGEIRVRYAAILIGGIRSFDLQDDEMVRMESIDRALSGGWLTDRTQALLESYYREYSPDSIPIPWLLRYGVAPAHVQHIETLSQRQSFVDGIPDDASCKSLGLIVDKVRPYIDSAERLQPDFRAENVVLWLGYLIEGHKDPRLKAAFARHRPDLNLPDYEALSSAWSKLGLAE